MAIIQQIENGKLVDSSASNTSLSTENKSDAAGGAFTAFSSADAVSGSIRAYR